MYQIVMQIVGQCEQNYSSKRMKKYFEKHQHSLPKAEQINQQNTQPNHNAQRFEVIPLFSTLKANKTNFFFKSNDTSKLISNLKLTHNLAKLPLNHKIHTSQKQQNEDQNYPTTRQRQQSQSSINSSSVIKQRGFSLQYLKMTKRHKVKQLLSYNQLQSNSKVVRSRTMFESPSSRREDKQGKGENRVSEEGRLLVSLSQRKEIQKGSELINTINDLKLPKTTTFYNKKKRINTLISNFAEAQQFMLNNPASTFINSPIEFIPIDAIRLDTGQKFFASNQIRTVREMNKTLLKKSKYSPFKSRNGSSASHNENVKGVQTKQFQVEDQSIVNPNMSQKDVKKYKMMKHKRIKTLGNATNKLQSEHNTQKQISPSHHQQSTPLLGIADDIQTTRILQQGLYGNIKLLNDLRECFQLPSDPKGFQIPVQKIASLVKTYVFGQKQQQKMYNNQLHAHLDHIFQNQEQKATIRKVVCCQRLLMVCVVDLLSHEKLSNLFEEVKLTLTTLIVIYLIVFKEIQKLQAYSHLKSEVRDYFNLLMQISKLKSNSPIEKHLRASLLPYIDNLFRYSKELYDKEFKQLIEDSKTRTINRTFYQTLKKYAIYLTNNEDKITNKSQAELVSSFATCPAPYILAKSQKRYSLCVDLDETLLFSKFTCTKKYQTTYRPGAKQFIIQLSKYYEIIVFTSAIKEYADQVIRPFVQFVDHVLYRYHVTRGKNLTNTVKDLSRIGRRLEKVIFVDDLECNIKLQPENSIRVTPWKGDTRDKELLQLKGVLLELGRQEDQRDDVRKAVSQIKEKLKSHKMQ